MSRKPFGEEGHKINLGTDIDNLFMQYISRHLQLTTDPNMLMFMGPDNGANNPAYFTTLDKIPTKYNILKHILVTVRSTAGLYSTTNRSNDGVEMAWCIAMDFDYDRGEWTGIDRKIQDITLYEFCKWIVPTATVKTGHGWHLYWVFDKPIPDGSYAYLASMFRKELKADTRSILPVQCLNFCNTNPRKPAVMVDRITFDSIGKEILTFPHDTKHYNYDNLCWALSGNSTENLNKLRKSMYDSKVRYLQHMGSHGLSDVKEESIDLLSKYDLITEFRRAGFSAYGRGDSKIICQCPFHDDKHPSAYIVTNPNSEYFGWLFCTSTRCHRHAPIKAVLKELGTIT